MSTPHRRFERRYPGRTGSNALGFDDDDDADGAAAAAAGGGRRSSGDEAVLGQRGSQRARRDDDVAEYGRRSRTRRSGEGGAGRGNPAVPGYLDEEDYEY